MADDLPATLRGELTGGSRPAEVRRLLLDELRAGDVPTLVTLDDAHWADEATLDVLRFLGRRLAPCPAMVVVTYREDEVGPRHPLRVLAGDLATLPVVRRLTVPMLSATAVARLATGSDVDPVELHRRTGGNAFFVTQVLADDRAAVPDTVRDAVLARAARLRPGARDALDALACLGTRAEPWVIEAVAGQPTSELDECVERGLLVAHGGAVAFRHELVRVAVEQAIAPGRAADLHRRALAVLRSRPPGEVEPARLVDHAQRAGDRAAVLAYTRVAAEQAAALGAHREAAAHLRRALDVPEAMPPADRAGLLEELGRQCHLGDDLEGALRAWQDSVAVWRDVGDDRRRGGALVGLAITALHLAREIPLGERRATRPSRCSPGSHPAPSSRSPARCAESSQRWRSAMPTRWPGVSGFSRRPTTGPLDRALALLSIGVGRAQDGDVAGLDMIGQSIRLARGAGAYDEAGLGYFWLQLTCVTRRWYREADRWYGEAMTFTEDHGQEIWRQWLRAFRSRALLEQGSWDAAEALAADVLRSAGVDDGRKMASMVVLGRLRARRGDAEPQRLLTRVRTTMATAEPIVGWIIGSTPALAESAAYTGADVRGIVTPALASAEEQGEPWLLGELAYWLSRVEGPGVVAPARAAEPYRLQLSGRWEEAAERWQAIGCPYEAALALADGDDEPALREALAVFDRLGAGPMRDITAHRLRQLGVRDVPRRPTPARPDGLSARERRSSPCSPTDCATPRSPGRCSCRHAPWSITSPPSCESSACRTGPKPRGTPGATAWSLLQAARGRGIVPASTSPTTRIAPARPSRRRSAARASSRRKLALTCTTGSASPTPTTRPSRTASMTASVLEGALMIGVASVATKQVASGSGVEAGAGAARCGHARTADDSLNLAETRVSRTRSC